MQKKRKVINGSEDSEGLDYSKINTDTLWDTDDIHNTLRTAIHTKFGGYYLGTSHFLLDRETNEWKVAYTPPVSTFNTQDPIDYYLNKAYQNTPDAKDVFDELMPFLRNHTNKNARILFNFNENNIHWKLCEIEIKKTNENVYHITTMMHDPYGHGNVSDYQFKRLKNSISKRIISHQPNAKLYFHCKKSPYRARQDPRDGTSCGVICVDDTTKRIVDKSLNLKKTYPIGTYELRKKFIEYIKNAPNWMLAGSTKENFFRKHLDQHSNHGSANNFKKQNFFERSESSYSITISVSDSSSDSEDSSDFDNAYFNTKHGHRPFSIDTSKAGDISSDESTESSEDSFGPEPMPLKGKQNPAYVLNIPAVANGKNNELQSRLHNVLFKEAFEQNYIPRDKEAQKRLRVTVGFNRMKSLRKSKNKLLKETLDEIKKDEPRIKAFGFLWKPKWRDNIKNKSVPWKRVRKWYKALKKKDSKRAKRIANELESKITDTMVPYQNIREKIKSHKYTRHFVRSLRERSDISHVYLSIFDDDFIRLRSKGTGLFTEYDRLIQDHLLQSGEPPHVLSTGYLISSISMPIIEVAVMLDMAVRQATSQYFKNAIYYCEPNSLILVQPNEDTVTASFISNGKSEKNELPTLINNILKKRGVNPNESFVFCSKNVPLTTQMPLRMLYANKKSKNRKAFEGDLTKDGKVLRFTFHDLQQLLNTSQSHVKARDWANRVVNSLSFPKEKRFLEVDLKQNEIKNIFSSLLARIFTCYNPIYTAKARLDAEKEIPKRINNFIYQLEYVCNNYRETLQFTAHSNADRSNIKDENIRNLRIQIDKIYTINSAHQILRHFVGHDVAVQIINAAKASGMAIRNILLKHLSFDFPQMVYSMLTDLFENYELGCMPYYTYDNLDHKMKEVLESLADNTFIKKYSKTKLWELNRQSFEFGTTLLHLAALSGNKAALRFLIRKGMDISDTTEDDVVTPLICAIVYCANHGNDLELISLCLEQEAVESKLSNGYNPLMIALTTLEDPWPVVNLLCTASPEMMHLRAPLKKLIELADPRELQTPLLAAIHHLPENTELALALINSGCDINKQGVIISRYKDDEHENITYPVCECISRGNFRLLYYLLKRGAIVEDIYDQHTRPPILIAYQDTYDEVPFIKLLLDFGANLRDTDSEGTYIIHELISPLSSPYNPPPNNEEEYKQQLYQDIHYLGYANYIHADLFEFLCRYDSDFLEIEDGAGNRPIDVALDARDAETVQKLILNGASTEHLKRKDFEFIRKNTYHTDLYHEKELEEKYQQEQLDLAEFALAREGIDLDSCKNYGEILSVLSAYGLDDEFTALDQLLAQQSDESEYSEEAEESSEFSSEEPTHYHDINDLDPLDFKYEDEEDIQGDEIDYPESPESPKPRKKRDREWSDSNSDSFSKSY